MAVEDLDCIVIGAGVIGLAIARELALAGRDVVVLEAEEAIGLHTSSRNSEVIHAGIYYQPGSLKARLCLEGREALYRYCAEHGVPHRRIGKLIVATEAGEHAALAAVERKALDAGVEDLRQLSAAEARRLEPELHCSRALLSPSTGQVDSHALMLSYLGEAEDRGAMVALNSPFLAGSLEEKGITVSVGGAEPLQLRCRSLVNAAGLGAQRVAALLAGFDPGRVPPRFLAKGTYYVLSGPSPFSRLIYPVPGYASLGVHVTVDLAGQCRFGPDVEWVESLDYQPPATASEAFEAAVRRYWPALRAGSLQPGYCGIRPKIAKGGQEVDFMIQGPREHGVPGLVNLFGLESPGLTASLAVARHVAALLA